VFFGGIDKMKTNNILTVFVIFMAAIIFNSCQLGSDCVITKAEYVNRNAFAVYYAGNPGVSVSFKAKGKDRRYDIRSSTILSLLDTKVTCRIDGNFISGDHITVTSDNLSGSAEFDVPDSVD
jgi:hypothetical protein